MPYLFGGHVSFSSIVPALFTKNVSKTSEVQSSIIIFICFPIQVKNSQTEKILNCPTTKQDNRLCHSVTMITFY